MYWKNKYRFLTMTLFLGVFSLVVGKANSSTIIASSDKGYPYYHMRLTLTPDNTRIISSVPRPSGQFELKIHSNSFPKKLISKIKSPYISLVMPATPLSMAGANLYISEKKQLFDNIQTMKAHKKSKVTVTVELNPYIKVLNTKPLAVELTQPTIIFRQAFGRYINYTGKLKSIDEKE